jgi:uncharacterized membrane protein
LTPDERVKAEGLVLILRELHDRLDALVFEAYGWPADLSDEDVIARLVALNKERVAEEAKGVVRWLRPDYQKRRAGIVEKVVQAAPEEQAEMRLVAEAGREQKPRFPDDEVARTAAVVAALAQSVGGIDAAGLAARFRQGRRLEPQIRATLASLTRLGFTSSMDGSTFWLRRVA